MGQDLSDAEQPAEGGNSVSPRELFNFVRGAAGRHVKLGIGVGVLVAALGIVTSLLLPPLYEANAKILITQNALITPVLSNPGRQLPIVDPMRGIADVVMKKDNLEAIVRDAKLPAQWEATRPWFLRVKDWLAGVVGGPLLDEEKVRALVGILETRIEVRQEDAGSLRIRVYWRDPEMTFKLAQLAKEKFLSLRRLQETSVIAAAIDILETEVKRAADAIDPELAAVDKARNAALKQASPKEAERPSEKAGDTKPASAVVMYARPRKAAATSDGSDASLSAQLNEIRQNIKNAQEPFQRHLTELRMQLADLRSVYGPEHPLVVQQDNRIKEASVEPAEIGELRGQERQLLSRIEEIATASAAEVPSVVRGSGVPAAPGVQPAAAAGPAAGPIMVEEAPEVAAARSKLMAAIGKYNRLEDRLDGARIELTTAETAFKYRYLVVAEPEPPRKAVKPNRPLLIVASLFAAVLLGLLAGAMKELASGRLIEPWQVRALGVPMLAEVELTPGRRLGP